MDKFKSAAYVASLIVSLFFAWQMSREQDRINHRLDVREAYFNKGLIDGAKEREKAYYEMRRQYEQILLHCQKKSCDLPDNLAIIPADAKFESLEAILTRNKE